MSSRFELPPSAEAFLKSGLYLRNWSTCTLRTYRQGLASLYQTVPAASLPTKEHLATWVMALRARGLKPGGCNMYIRTVNSFLSWLKEEDQISTPLRVKILRAPQHQITLLSPADVRAILLFKPNRRIELRTWVLTLLLLDTGIRIDEALNIERKRVDLDNLSLVVMGKGRKERQVPFSHEMRKILYRWMSKAGATTTYLFNTQSGARVLYRNAFRDVQRLMSRVGISVHAHPHLFRHQFAATYIRQGGDIYRLSRLLGHTSISTTQIYLRSMGVEDLRAGQERLTPLHVT